MPTATKGGPLRLQARDFNRILQAADAAQSLHVLGAPVLQLPPLRSGWLWVKNISGAARARFAVLGLGDVLISPADNFAEWARPGPLEAYTPAAGNENTFVILQEPLADDAIGRALACGVSPVQITRPAGNTDKFCGIDAGSAAHLKCGVQGAQIIWEDTYSTTEDHWALVRIPQGGGGGGVSLVKCASTADLDLSGAETIDGIGVTAGDKVLVKNQATGSQNGVYTVASGAWTRDGIPDLVATQSGTLAARVLFIRTAATTYASAYGTLS